MISTGTALRMMQQDKSPSVVIDACLGMKPAYDAALKEVAAKRLQQMANIKAALETYVDQSTCAPATS